MQDIIDPRTITDTARVNVHETEAIMYWTTKWQISEEQLMTAINATGSKLAGVIEIYLREKKIV